MFGTTLLTINSKKNIYITLIKISWMYNTYLLGVGWVFLPEILVQGHSMTTLYPSELERAPSSPPHWGRAQAWRSWTCPRSNSHKWWEEGWSSAAPWSGTPAPEEVHSKPGRKQRYGKNAPHKTSLLINYNTWPMISDSQTFVECWQHEYLNIIILKRAV